MLEFYHNVPAYLSATIFTVGGFSLYWYSVLWIVAFVCSYSLLLYRITKNEGPYTKEFVQDVLLSALVGALVGGRVGYVVFYNFSYYSVHPIEIISPYSFALHEWVGIYGMSYHGGLIGVVCALLWVSHKNKRNVLRVSDFIVPVVPMGYFFGRIGNFMNEELVGHVTQSQWGMYFNGETVLRHPSQLYEGLFEGIVLFALLWHVRKKKWARGTMSALYIIGYAVARFFVEYFRQPDAHIGYVWRHLSMGQVLSLSMFCFGCFFLAWAQWYYKSAKV